MSDEHKTGLSKRADQLDAFTKPFRNLAWLGAFILIPVVEFAGPGLSSMLREHSGVNDLQINMTKGFNDTGDRLEFIEDNMAPPKIVNWLDDRQIGNCGNLACRKIHTISRTEYGESCGIPSLTIELRLSSGERYPLQSNFTPIDADTISSRVIHNFILEDFVPNGVHNYQFTLLYPSCEWSKEPLPRHSPWFELVVSR